MRPVDRELPGPERAEAFDHDASAPRDRPDRCRDTSAARRAAGTARRRARSRLPSARRRGAPGRARTARGSSCRVRPPRRRPGPPRSRRRRSPRGRRRASGPSRAARCGPTTALRPRRGAASASLSRSPLAVVQERPVTVPQHGQAEGGARLHQTRSRCRLNASCALILPSTRSRFISSTVPAATQT